MNYDEQTFFLVLEQKMILSKKVKKELIKDYYRYEKLTKKDYGIKSKGIGVSLQKRREIFNRPPPIIMPKLSTKKSRFLRL